MSTSDRIQHVLFDADGVLQTVPGGWFEAMERYVGERSREFLYRTWKDELPMLAGQGEYLPLLEALLIEYGVRHSVDEVYADVWHRIEVDERSLAIVAEVRAAGFGVHLGTNQERHRAAYMKDNLGYGELFDSLLYSCDLGAAKPDAAYFETAARMMGATDPATILFIDDAQRNIDGALAAGLRAERWDLEQGHDVLREILASHGVMLS